MRLWRRKAKEEAPSNVFHLMDQTLKFMTGLRAMGGFGYVLLGFGFLFLLALTFFAANISAVVVGSLLPLSIVLVTLGAVFVIVERVMTYRMAELRLRMIISITEKLVVAAIPSDGQVDSAVIRSITNDVLREVWALQVPEGQMKT